MRAGNCDSSFYDPLSPVPVLLDGDDDGGGGGASCSMCGASPSLPPKVLRIIAAVVPASLNFELNQCLRMAVISLQKHHGLACTEQWRIPLAGKVCPLRSPIPDPRLLIPNLGYPTCDTL